MNLGIIKIFNKKFINHFHVFATGHTRNKVSEHKRIFSTARVFTKQMENVVETICFDIILKNSLPLIRFSTTPYVPRFARNLNQWTTGPRPKNASVPRNLILWCILHYPRSRIETWRVVEPLSAPRKSRTLLQLIFYEITFSGDYTYFLEGVQ